MYSFGFKTMKYPILHWFFHTHLESKYIQNLICCYHFCCYHCGLQRKSHRHLVFILGYCYNHLTSCCSVSIFVSLQNPHAIGSFQNADQIMSHSLFIRVSTQALLDPHLSSSSTTSPLCSPSEVPMELSEEDLCELQALVCIPALVPGCFAFSLSPSHDLSLLLPEVIPFTCLLESPSPTISLLSPASSILYSTGSVPISLLTSCYFSHLKKKGQNKKDQS